MKKQEQLIEDAFSIFNGGKGLDHWSYSSTSTPFSKNLISYTFPQEVRRTFAFRYKANFGNLVNNTVQKLIGHEVWKTSKMKEEKWDRDFNKIFQNELGMINEKPPVDNKDKFAREQMIDYAIDCSGHRCQRLLRICQTCSVSKCRPIGRISYAPLSVPHPAGDPMDVVLADLAL